LTAVIFRSFAVVVPRDFAVDGMNWIRPVAPLPGLTISARNVLADSNAIAAMRWFGSMPSLAEMAITFSLKALSTFLPQASSMAESVGASKVDCKSATAATVRFQSESSSYLSFLGSTEMWMCFVCGLTPP